MIYLDDLVAATDGDLPNGTSAIQFSSFAFDSRQIEPGQLFMAVRTATGDGHDFIETAIQQGATGVLCETTINLPTLAGITVIVVSDSQQALKSYATFILKKYNPKMVGVTGSNGKTTAKEAIAAILQKRYRVFKNYGSYNGRYGLPIALGDLEPDHEIAVLEMASDSFGEIAELVEMAPPDVGVITAINRTHLARLGTLDNVASEKGRLIAALPFTGAAILNADDPRVAGMVPRTQGRILTFGLKRGADVWASDVTISAEGLTFTLHYEGKSYDGNVPLLGKHQIYPILAAITTGLIFNISPKNALATLEKLPRVPGRMNPLRGKNGTLILDDTFNASPEAMIAAIDTLVELPGATKVAILGDMPELGDETNPAHQQVGEYVSTRVQRLITKGEAAQQIARTAQVGSLGKRAVHVTFTSDDACAAVDDLLSPDTVVLVKGGAEVRMENVVQRLLAEPKRDTLKLVRQGAGWKQVRFRQPARPTWVEIDLEAVANNVRLLSGIANPAKVMAILKADAYGHGMEKVARTVLNNGASWVGVATLGEGIKLRENGIDAPILVLSYMPAWQAHEAVSHNIRATIFSPEIARAYSQAASDLNEQAYVHVKVDSGMGRLGLLPQDVQPFLESIKLPGLKVEGIYTHFATADEADLTQAHEQLTCFNDLLTQLKAANLCPPIVHAANTAGLINLPQARFDLVRPGIGIYGLCPSKEMSMPAGFKPALTFKSTIGQVKTLPADSPIGYGATYRTQGEETIAIIPVGYADGFRRGPQTWGEVLVKGKRAPLIGRVSMDQSAISVSHIPNVRQGDEVVLIGRQGDETITAEEVADQLGTINYEVVSELLARIPRIS
ncbi:alanine racemase [Anaerolineales bacterium HSG25]|nr:alanine racemase [Anaerolineales bacterium HSG25]